MRIKGKIDRIVRRTEGHRKCKVILARHADHRVPSLWFHIQIIVLRRKPRHLTPHALVWKHGDSKETIDILPQRTIRLFTLREDPGHQIKRCRFALRVDNGSGQWIVAQHFVHFEIDRRLRCDLVRITRLWQTIVQR